VKIKIFKFKLKNHKLFILIKIQNERQYFLKNVTYLLAFYLSVIRIQFFYVACISLLVVISIIYPIRFE
jgi:hypothetical protein